MESGGHSIRGGSFDWFKHWTTCGGKRVEDARCSPWWGHDGHFRGEYVESVGSTWTCNEVDDLNRIFGVHVRAYRDPYALGRPVDFRCDDRFSQYAYPN
jgi:hypothetical protein